MKIQVKVPHWVTTDNERICILFAFLRRVQIEFNNCKQLDVYGYDVRKIVDREEANMHLYLQDHIDTRYCKIGKLSQEHFVFEMTNWRRDLRTVEITQLTAQLCWAYLMGCTNYNLLEDDGILLGNERRPHYTPMYKLDREIFGRSGKGHYVRNTKYED